MSLVDKSPSIVLDDEILVEYYRFYLQDMARMRTPSSIEVVPGLDWLMLGGPGGAVFNSHETDHNAAVRLEYWTQHPAEPDEPWTESAEGSIDLDSHEVRLWSVTAALGKETLALPSSGEYKIRAYVWRSEDASEVDDLDDDLDVEDEDPFPADRERWLLQLWPASAAS